jgi:uncharacterized protein
MPLIKRFVEDTAFSPEFSRQMRFVAGPRQSGKTTIAKNKLKESDCENFYYNWDNQEVRDRYRKEPDFLRYDTRDTGSRRKLWVCFDEIHKVHRWKNILKGHFDTYEGKVNFIVTGSARLDVLRKAGDSLAGRYFQFKLNPFIMAEVLGRKHASVMPEETGEKYIEKIFSSGKPAQALMEDFIKFSAFPEPLLSDSAVMSAKWHDNYYERVTKEDLRDLSAIHSLGKVVDLLHLMPSKIGSPISINSLKEDLELNFSTVKNYINYLGLIYIIFLVPPYTPNINRALKKEKKAYFYNYSLVENEGARFENFAALELKSRIDLWNDALADRFGLFYIKTREGKETDFLITRNAKPYLLLEAKLSETSIDSHHRLNSARLGNIPFVQLVKAKNAFRAEKKLFYAVSASRFFA